MRFRQIFAIRIETETPFNIWYFITPTIRLNDLVRLLDNYIRVQTEEKPPFGSLLPAEEVLRRKQSDCKFPAELDPKKGKAKADPGGKMDEQHFVHICPYCEALDSNRRKDHVGDHLITWHYFYLDAEKMRNNQKSARHHRRVKAFILLGLIRAERRALNSLNEWHCAARKATAEILGREAAASPDLLVVEGGLDLSRVKKSKQQEVLAKILVRERESYGHLRGAGRTEQIVQEVEFAWRETEKQPGRGPFDWASI